MSINSRLKNKECCDEDPALKFLDILYYLRNRSYFVEQNIEGKRFVKIFNVWGRKAIKSRAQHLLDLKQNQI